MQNELYALMGELGRFHGGHELQRRVRVSLKTVEPRFSLWRTVKNTNECREYLQGIFRYTMGISLIRVISLKNGIRLDTK